MAAAIAVSVAALNGLTKFESVTGGATVAVARVGAAEVAAVNGVAVVGSAVVIGNWVVAGSNDATAVVVAANDVVAVG